MEDVRAAKSGAYSVLPKKTIGALVSGGSMQKSSNTSFFLRRLYFSAWFENVMSYTGVSRLYASILFTARAFRPLKA